MSDRLALHHLDTAGATAGQVPTYDPATDSYVPGAGGGSSSTFAPSAGRSPRLVPYGVKLRGGNIVPQGSAGNPWADMYANWSSKWASTVKPQIDKAASVGANALRLIGDIGGVHTGTLTQDAYVAAYEQFVDYCHTMGLYVYACLASAQHFDGATKEQALPVMQAQAAMLDAKPNVIGIDVVQEIGLMPSLWSGSTEHDFLSYLFSGVRTVTNLPLTCSVLGSNNSTAAQWNDGTVSAFADLVDFYDYHPYYDGMTTADLNPFFAATSKPLVLGEYGESTTDGRYTAAATVSALSGVVGSFVWAVADNGSGEGNGLFDYTLVERPNRTAIFRTVPDHQGTLPESGHTVQDEGTTLPARGRLNFVGVGVTAADDPSNDATTVTVPGAGLTVQDENGTIATGVTQLDFQGLGVTATAGTGEVVVTVPGGGSGAGELLMQDGVTGPPVPLENEARSDWLYQG